MRKATAILAVLGTAMLQVPVRADESAPPLELGVLIKEALAANPSLVVLQQRADAARGRVPQAGALADPRLKMDLSNAPLSDFDFASTPMSGRQVALAQRFPYWGKSS